MDLQITCKSWAHVLLFSQNVGGQLLTRLNLLIFVITTIIITRKYCNMRVSTQIQITGYKNCYRIYKNN